MTQERETIHVGQLQIANRQMVRAAVKQVDRRGAGGSSVDGIAFISEMLTQRVSHHWFIIDNQNPGVFILCLIHFGL